MTADQYLKSGEYTRSVLDFWEKRSNAGEALRTFTLEVFDAGFRAGAETTRQATNNTLPPWGGWAELN